MWLCIHLTRRLMLLMEESTIGCWYLLVSLLRIYLWVSETINTKYFLVPLQLSYSSYLCRKLGPGESKPLQEVDTGVGPGRLVVLNQPILLNDAIEKLKNHLKLDHLRLAVGVSIDRGKTFV